MAENDKQQHMITLGAQTNQSMARHTQQAVEETKNIIQSMLTIGMMTRRNQPECEREIMLLCQDLDFAEKALYEYPRGTEKIVGLSIYAVNEIKRIWGCLYDGWQLLDAVKGIVREEIKTATGKMEVVETETFFTPVRAYCIDLQKCNLTFREFKVPHRFKAGGKDNPHMKDLFDERDVYEYCANLGQRRKRSCIEEQIPRHVRNAAITQIKETKLNADSRPIAVRVQIMLDSFAKVKIPEAAVLNYLGCTKAAITAQQISDLKSIYVALADGEAKIADFFDVTAKPKDPPKSRKTKKGAEVTPTEGSDVVDVQPVAEAQKPAAEAKPEPPKEEEKKAEPEKASELPEMDLEGEEEGDEEEGGDEPDASENAPMQWGFQ